MKIGLVAALLAAAPLAAQERDPEMAAALEVLAVHGVSLLAPVETLDCDQLKAAGALSGALLVGQLALSGISLNAEVSGAQAMSNIRDMHSQAIWLKPYIDAVAARMIELGCPS